MTFEFTLLTNPHYINLKQGLLGWLGWLLLLSLLVVLSYQQIQADKSRTRSTTISWRRVVFVALLILLPFTSLFLVIRLPAGNALPPPGQPIEPIGPALVVLAMLPIFLAAGFLDAKQTLAVGAGVGLCLAVWETHSPFTLLEYAILSILLYASFQQRYRTAAFKLLRYPLPAAGVLAFLYPILLVYSAVFTAQGGLPSRLDYAFTQLPYGSLAMAGELLFASLFAMLAYLPLSDSWGNTSPMESSPAERSLAARFLFSLAPLAVALVLTLMAVSWNVAGRVTRDMIRSRMQNSAETAASVIPFFMETGQNLIQQTARDPRWFTTTPEEATLALQDYLRSVPYFTQFILLDEQSNIVSSYPSLEAGQSTLSTEEKDGLQIALAGVPFQTYAIPPVESGQSAQVSFIASVIDEATQAVKGVLIGRTDLNSNPFMLSMLVSLNSMNSLGGYGLLTDENQRILYHSNYSGLMDSYLGPTSTEPLFTEDQAPDGTRQLIYFQPALGHPWAIVLTVPSRQAQQQALNISAPLLAMILVLFIIAALLLRFSLRRVTGSLKNLAHEADLIARGNLGHPLPEGGEDEAGQLSRSFEQMRLSLKARLDELNRLLIVSQGVASSLEMEEAVKPVLESALSIGACAARIVLSPAAFPDAEGEAPHPTRFGTGPSSEMYSFLDDQILTLAQQQNRIVLNNLSRVRIFSFPPEVLRPEALIALALRHETTFYGVMWLVFEHPHPFSDDEIRFLETLDRQTEVAATNARLFLNAEVGRQRLAGILASTPDPVLVTDQQNRLLLANPAAWQVLEVSGESSEGKPLEQVIPNRELVQLLTAPVDSKNLPEGKEPGESRTSAEILLPDGRTYLAMSSPLIAGEHSVGRVCILRDVTHFKELDALKSEFVATVSHDLRSPLTLIRGYATMLEMVGELNEQQNNYAKKIMGSVETMARLVNNLLDLGRIEAGIGLQLEMVHVREILEKVVSSLQLAAAQKQIQLTLEASSDTTPLIEADPALLQQALSNIIENAIKYTNANGKVTVRTLSHDGNIVFEVSDTGIGIAPVDQPRLFEKFFRGVQRDARKQQGSGLGLAIVKSIVERHGGKVWVESQLGKGSTFSILIPIRQPTREK
jgi:signal transduction histidine kinase/HAMP domain-containing protein